MGRNKASINIKYTCKGASKEVTGSCHMLNIYVEGKPFNIVIDCGQVQNQLKSMNEMYEINKKFNNIDWKSVNAIVSTHAHL